MAKIFDVAIIGGGASGLMCANFLDTKKMSVVIIDKDFLGKKLLVTGNGRCNLTNQNVDAEKYNTNLVKEVLKEFDKDKTLSFFKSIGIETFADDEGRYYPLSETAKDVKDALVNNLKNVETLKDEVQKVHKKEHFEIVLVSKEKIYAKKVVMACGNEQIKEILQDFGFKFEDSKNILTGFEVKDFDKKLMGVREDAIVKQKDCGFYEKGQIQFRKDGLSGIVIFNLSAQKLSCPFDIQVEFLPTISKSKLKELMYYRKTNCSNMKIKDALIGLIKPNLAEFMLKKSKINNIERSFKDITDREIDILVNNLKEMTFVCEKTYEDCQVLSGGVDLKNLNKLESNIKDLYFCGESTNVFGPCGGYNLQWAFSSGYFVAKELNKKI